MTSPKEDLSGSILDCSEARSGGERSGSGHGGNGGVWSLGRPEAKGKYLVTLRNAIGGAADWVELLFFTGEEWHKHGELVIAWMPLAPARSNRWLKGCPSKDGRYLVKHSSTDPDYVELNLFIEEWPSVYADRVHGWMPLPEPYNLEAEFMSGLHEDQEQRRRLLNSWKCRSAKGESMNRNSRPVPRALALSCWKWRNNSWVLLTESNAIVTSISEPELGELEGAGKSVIIKRDELARLLSISPVTIWRWDRDGKLPPKLKLGPNTVGWRRDEIMAWLETKTVYPTEAAAT